MSPQGYLTDSVGTNPVTGKPIPFCLFGITPLPKVLNSRSEMFLFGDVFLRNYYSVYNMNDLTVSFAVDVEAKDFASME